ncbi:hypothetical protein L7F22_056188 [Adiantum nelumboides]|nr:hypothetical protein [Adiantum nelumboides]
MPFGLTNAPATFQRFMNHVFQAFFGKSIRVYIDDFCIYSSRALHVQKVEEGLQRLSGFGGELNLDKCHIEEDEVILLGHKISQRGIEVDPTKAKALLELPSPKSIKEVTSFMQKVKYMARFIHLASELLHLLQKLTQQIEFAWSEDLEEYFESIKMVLYELPTLMPPCWDYPFFVNPSVAAESLGAIFLQQDPHSSRMKPVYFTSKVTTTIEKGYRKAELMMLALIFAVRKFRSYLITKPFVILTSKNLLPWVSSQMTMSPRISKWLIELQSYEYTFKVENSVQAQLAGILTYQLHEKVIKVPNVKPLPPPPPKVLSNAYTLFFDGAFRRATGKEGGGLVLVNPEGEVVMKEQVTLDGSTSNNEAEYDVLISGLKICLAQKIQRLMVVKGRQEQHDDEAWIDRLFTLVELEWKREAAYHCYESKALQLKDKLNEGLTDKGIKEKSLVLRYNNALDNRFDTKFEHRWEGPFIVKKAFTGGYYQLMDLNGKEHPRKVNGYRLKPYLSRILPAVFEINQAYWKEQIYNDLVQKKQAKPIHLASLKPEDMDMDEWIELDELARSTIMLTLHKSIYFNVKDTKGTYGVWQALNNLYEKKSATSQEFWLKMILHKKETTPVLTHLNEFKTILSQLQAQEVEFQDSVKAMFLLVTFPDSWDTFHTVINILAPENDLKCTDVDSNFLMEELNCKNVDDFRSSNAMHARGRQ